MSIGFSTYGTLYPPQVALKAQSSIKGFVVDSFHKFGNVNAINYACISTNVGASVLFKVDDAVLVTAYGASYYVIDESKLLFKENQ